MGKNNDLGRWGEQLAAEYLKKKRYKVLTTNFHSHFGEIDLVAVNGGYLVFVEVKLRKNADFARAREYVDWRKQRRLRATAEVYLMYHPTQLQPRFDVIEIYAPEGLETIKPVINHLEDAFA